MYSVSCIQFQLTLLRKSWHKAQSEEFVQARAESAPGFLLARSPLLMA
jgi:hypothetical protein